MTPGFPTVKKFPVNPLKWLTFGVPIMDRYIAGELLAPFLFCVGAFSTLGVAIGVLFDLSRKIADSGLSPIIAFQILMLKLPYFVSFSFPISLLIASLFIYDQLSGNSELIALRSCGVSIWRLVVPSLALSLIITGITFIFNEAVVPAANRQATATLERAIKGQEPQFRESNIYYPEYRSDKMLSRIFYAREFDGRQMLGLTILDFSKTGLNQIVVAESAVWNAAEQTWDFYNGTIYAVDVNGSYRNILRFDQQQLQLSRAPLDIAKTTTDPIEMNMADIRRYLKTVGEGGNQKEATRLRLRLEQKISFPFICPVFGFVGAVLGIRSQRSGRRAVRFVIGLLIILFYFLSTQICETLYLLGVLTPTLAAWIPNIAITGMGVALLMRINR